MVIKLKNSHLKKKMKLIYFITISAFLITSAIFLAKFEKNYNYGRGSIQSYREFAFTKKS